MNHVWHLFRKDLRQHRVLMACLWVLVLVQTLLYVQNLQQTLHPIADNSSSLDSWVNMLATFKFLLLFLYIPAVTQAESLVGTTQFWLTRPIARLQVLREKALYIALVIWLPLLLPELAAFLVFGATGREIVLLVPQVLTQWAVYLMALALFANVTPTVTKFALWIIGLFVGVQVLTILLEMLSPLLSHSDSVPLDESNGGGSTCALVSMALLLIGGAAVAFYHYSKRRTGWVIVWTVVLGLALSTTFVWWRWDFWGDWTKAVAARRITAEEAKLVRSDEVQISAYGETMSHGDARLWKRGRKIDAQKVSIRTKVESANPVVNFWPQKIKTTLLESDRAVWTGDKLRVTDHRRDWFVYQQILSPILPGVRILNAPEKPKLEWDIDYASVPYATFQEWRGKTLSARAEMELRVVHYVTHWTLPLEKQARWRGGSSQVEISDLLYEKEGCTVKLSSIVVSLFLDPYEGDRSQDVANGRFVCLLVNAKRSEAIVQDQAILYINEWGSNLGRDPLSVQSRELKFTGKQGESRCSDDDAAAKRLSDVHLPRDWFRDAQLVCVELKEIGSVKKTIEIPGLKFGDDK